MTSDASRTAEKYTSFHAGSPAYVPGMAASVPLGYRRINEFLAASVSVSAKTTACRLSASSTLATDDIYKSVGAT